jgi:DNA-directed RNA polymerase specialized sigma24 family protein
MPKSAFETTSWSLVRAAGNHPSTDAREALGTLCQKYWPPVYAFIRRSGHDRAQSEDLTQGFFALLIEKQYLLDADPARGRFRSFLLAATRHYLSNERDRAQAAKRGGAHVPISIDVAEIEAWHELAAVELETPESLYERRWALSVLKHVMATLRAEFVAAGKAEEFDRLSGLLVRDSNATSYEALAEASGVSAGALRMSVHRLRRRYRTLLRAEIAMLVSTPEDIDEELRALRASLSGPGHGTSTEGLR